MRARARHRLALLRAQAQRGSATVFVVGFAIILFAASGLAIDGGRAINARERAIDSAEQAARAGAAAVNVAALRQTGAIVLDQGAAGSAAANYLNAAGYLAADYTIDPQPNAVTVTVGFDSPTVMLGIIGINSIPVSGEATAAPATGIGGAIP